MAWDWENKKGLISPELDGFLLLNCLNKKGVSCGKGQIARKAGTGIEVYRIARLYLAVMNVPLPVSTSRSSGD